MRIVIVGAGEVGYNVAETRSTEGYDVTVVEQDDERAAKTESELDVLVVRGNGARPNVLEQAGVTPGCDIDILVACTDHDEINILACWIAKRCGVSRVIARARGLEFTDSPTLGKELGIDVMHSPERSVAREIMELLSVSSAVQTGELLDGQAGMYAFHLAHGSPLIGATLKELRQKYPDFTAIIVYLEREGGGEVPHGETPLREGDLCYVVTAKDYAWRLEEYFTGKKSTPLRRVLIVGGGKIGYQVARRLETQFRNVDIRLIDREKDKCERLAEELERTLVLCGEGADDELLRQEGVDEADGFVAATESDEANLMLGVVGKSLGARKSIAVARKTLYQRLDPYISVDAIVNPNQALASVILRYVRYPSGTGTLSIIEKIDAEMLELYISDQSPALGAPVAALGLPSGILLALVVRKGRVFVPGGTTLLQADDRAIVFATSDLMDTAVEMLRGI